MRVSFYVIVCVLLLNFKIVHAMIKMPALFGNDMVLQQDANTPIWGLAEANEQIAVETSWDNSKQHLTAGPDGKWFVKVKTPKAGGPYNIIVSGQNKINLQNVLIGEVWICSGQSNMGFALNQAANTEEEVPAARNHQIRFFTIKSSVSSIPEANCNGSWSECTPETAAQFSAVAYFFGKRLQKELNVPVGLVQASYAGTPAEAWVGMKALQAEPDFAPILLRYAKGIADFNNAQKEHAKELAQWEEAIKQASILKKPTPPKPYYLQMDQTGPGHSQSPSGLYNGMIAPLIPYCIRGVIWYQGECNAWRAYQYRKLFPSLIENWRKEWQQGDFPFYYVQIAPFNYSIWDTIDEPIGPELREAQMMALAIPNTGMAVTMDIGDINDIHPKNKKDVGDRLARLALAKTYNRHMVYSGPIYKFMRIEDSNSKTQSAKAHDKVIRLFFDHADSGLIAKGDNLTCFEIAGEDRTFVSANALIDGNTIIVYNNKVKNPVAVRFAWSNTAVPNLFNKDGLPASSFRTDDWPGVTVGRN
ncbi:MAG: hypothetical protein A2Y12_05000 [Planctomycetes bacterium GWF2_42_9]|nr:MAG: hypothetical protein A2Y12_05000 [Planctomycetes bacterium GWF2_42_9]